MDESLRARISPERVKSGAWLASTQTRAVSRVAGNEVSAIWVPRFVNASMSDGEGWGTESGEIW